MKYIVEDDYLNSNNILISIEKMPNTELRYRLKIDDNTLYSVTKSGRNSLGKTHIIINVVMNYISCKRVRF